VRFLRVTAALLGRFLPRLGPLAPASGPFFVFQAQNDRSDVIANGFPVVQSGHVYSVMLLCSKRDLLGGRSIGSDFFHGYAAKSLGERLEIRGQLHKCLAAFVAPFVHIKAAIDFELNGMQPR
jgi:hypothetical protein